MPEPEYFWSDTYQEPESEDEIDIRFLREELGHIGVVIQSVLLETHQEKDLFYYQEETQCCLLSGYFTSALAACKHWGYLHALKLTRGIQYQPVSLLYTSERENKIYELRRNICIEANRCNVEEVNAFFYAMADSFKTRTHFDKTAHIDNCERLKKHCEDIVKSTSTQLEKEICINKIRGTLSLCYPSSLPADQIPEGIKEVHDRFVGVVENVFGNRGKFITNQEDKPEDYKFFKAKPYFEALRIFGVLNADYTYKKKKKIFFNWRIAYAAEIIKAHSGLTLKRIDEILDIKNTSSQIDFSRDDLTVVDDVFKAAGLDCSLKK